VHLHAVANVDQIVAPTLGKLRFDPLRKLDHAPTLRACSQSTKLDHAPS
jgi:hypothetical protein